MFRVQIHDIRNATVEEKKAFRAAAIQLELELNNPDFWLQVAEVYNTWRYKKPTAFTAYPQPFADFKEMVLSGADKFNTEKDGDLDLLVTMYYSFAKVVGYTTPRTWYTWANRNIIEGFDLGELAGHIAHEYLHNCGLGHPNADRQSVVYQFGYLIRRRIQERLNGPNEIKLYYPRSIWGRIKRLIGGIFWQV